MADRSKELKTEIKQPLIVNGSASIAFSWKVMVMWTSIVVGGVLGWADLKTDIATLKARSVDRWTQTEMTHWVNLVNAQGILDSPLPDPTAVEIKDTHR